MHFFAGKVAGNTMIFQANILFQVLQNHQTSIYFEAMHQKLQSGPNLADFSSFTKNQKVYCIDFLQPTKLILFCSVAAAAKKLPDLSTIVS